MSNTKFSQFHQRFIAVIFDNSLFLLLLSFILSQASVAGSVAQLTYLLLIFLMVLISPLMLFYQLLMISFFGATLGKLICGLEVQNLDGKGLSFKRLFFRQTVGYSFSWLFFGVGYLAIFKNERRQAWHDSVIGSVVIEKRSTWIVGLVLVVAMLAFASNFVFQSYRGISNNQAVINEGSAIFNEFKEALKSSPKPSGSAAPFPEEISQKALNDQKKVYALIGQKKYREASDSASLMLKESKNNLDKALAYQVTGETYVSQNKFKEAKVAYTEGLKLSDQLPHIYLGLADVSIWEKNYLQAKEYSEKAIKLNEQNSAAYYMLGLSYFFLKDRDNAIENIEKAIELDPKNENYPKELESVKEQLN